MEATREKPIVGGTLEENTRIINLIIGRLMHLESRVNAIADCIDNIQETAKKLEEIFAILSDDLRDDAPAGGGEGGSPVGSPPTPFFGEKEENS